jgi:transketolase
MAKQDDRIVLITADLGYGVLEPFQKAFPDRFFNVGIAEQNAVGVAAGMASQGKIPYVYSIIPFLTGRAYEQIRVDVAYAGLPVRLVGVGAGLTYGSAGPTHHAIEDIAIMRALPGMTIVCPGSWLETSELIRESTSWPGPIYFRLGKDEGDDLFDDPVRIGCARRVKRGSSLSIITTSNMLRTGVEVARLFEQRYNNLTASVTSLHTVKPLDIEFVDHEIDEMAHIVTIEEHSLIGGLGSAISERMNSLDNYGGTKILTIGLPDEWGHEIGSHDHLRRFYGLDSDSIYRKILRWLR